MKMLREIYKNNKVHIVEQPPTKRTIFIGKKSYFLSFPYIIFVNAIHKYIPNYFFYYLSEKSIESIHDRLKILDLGNTSSDGFVCLGRNDFCGENITINMIDEFWNTAFSGYNILRLNKVKIPNEKFDLSKLDSYSLKQLSDKEGILIPFNLSKK